MLINAGVMEIVYAGEYPDNLAKLMMDESGLKIKRFK
jgi:deoxycytidylate deaminase